MPEQSAEKPQTVNRRDLARLSTIRSEGPDGKPREYMYHRDTRVRIHARLGTPEFAEEYQLAAYGHRTLKGRKLIESRRKDPPRDTNVYFIRAEATGLIKIGKAENVARRLSVLQIGSPEPLTLLATVPDTSGGLLERAIHRDFGAHRTRGEWFNPADELLAYIRSLDPLSPLT